MTDERFMKPGLDHATGKLVEECGEVLAGLGKSIRHGWKSVNPLIPVEQQETNIDWVIRELNDLEDACVRFRNEATKAGLIK